MRIAICENDKQALKHLTVLLEEYRDTRKITISCRTFKHGSDLLFNMKASEYDIILLDGLTTGIDGIQSARAIRAIDTAVKILVLTASPNFIKSSPMADTYFHLIKPATDASLFPLLDKINDELTAHKENSLLIRDRDGITRLPFSKLEYVEVMNKNLTFHLTDGSVRVCFGSLSDYEEDLLKRPEFVKIYRSFLINLKQIKCLSARGVITNTGHTIPISRSIYPQVKRLYMQYRFEDDEAAPTAMVPTSAPPIIRKKETDSYEILIVDDEPEQILYWSAILKEKGCSVYTAQTGEAALHLAAQSSYDCILLDVMLPGDSGYSLCTKLQNLTTAPVVFLSCCTDCDSQLTGFQSGGIDYITKDTPKELFWAKIESRIRFSGSIKKQLQHGPLELNLSQRKVQLDGQDISLTSTEFDLLRLLAENPTLIFTPKELYYAIWGTEQWDNGQTIQVHMSRLRKKLDKAYPQHSFFETVWGRGYLFVPPNIS